MSKLRTLLAQRTGKSEHLLRSLFCIFRTLLGKCLLRSVKVFAWMMRR
jgi:hypothetical protein